MNDIEVSLFATDRLKQRSGELCKLIKLDRAKFPNALLLINAVKIRF